jgi:hypothetical protein
MKRNLFREEQIIMVLREQEARGSIAKSAASTGSAAPRLMRGRLSLAGWMVRRLGK